MRKSLRLYRRKREEVVSSATTEENTNDSNPPARRILPSCFRIRSISAPPKLVTGNKVTSKGNPEKKLEEKTEEKTEEKPAEEPAEKQEKKLEKKPEEGPAEKQDKKLEEKPEEGPAEKQEKKLVNKPEEGPAEKQDKKLEEKLEEGPAEKEDKKLEEKLEEPEEKPEKKAEVRTELDERPIPERNPIPEQSQNCDSPTADIYLTDREEAELRELLEQIPTVDLFVVPQLSPTTDVSSYLDYGVMYDPIPACQRTLQPEVGPLPDLYPELELSQITEVNPMLDPRPGPSTRPGPYAMPKKTYRQRKKTSTPRKAPELEAPLSGNPGWRREDALNPEREPDERSEMEKEELLKKKKRN